MANKRTRKLWQSVWATAAGLALVAAAGYWIEQRRNTDLQDPAVGVTAEFLHQLPDDAPQLELSNVAEELGINMQHGPNIRRRTLPEDTGSGLAWGDYDGDGDFDLYVVNFASNHLYRNDGQRFVDVTEEAGVGDPQGFGMGASFADFDDDGDEDLYVTNHGADRLFQNLGDGSFEDVTAELGLSDLAPQWSIAAAWGDIDRDGRLDLYVTHYVDFDLGLSASESTGSASWQGVPYTMNPNAFDPQPNRLYRQLASGGFEEVALGRGVSNPDGRSLAATLVDVDGDGWLDIYVANDVSPNALFHNLAATMDGEAFFEDWSAATGSADPRGSMGIAVADLGGAEGPDGLPDFFITHWVAQENALYQAMETASGKLEYRDKVRELRLAEISTDRVGWGCGFIDLDLDGWVDLAVANGSTLEEKDRGVDPTKPRDLIGQPLFLFWNNGERFYNVAPSAGNDLARDYVARGLALADFDLDGDADIAVSVNRGRPLLLRNDLQRNGRQLERQEPRSLGVRLAARASSAFGARLTLESGVPGGPNHKQVHYWGGDASFASAHAAEWIVGLGSATEVVLSVRWADGRQIKIRGLGQTTFRRSIRVTDHLFG